MKHEFTIRLYFSFFTTISLMFLKINVYKLYYQCDAGIENWYPFEVTKS